MSGLTSLGYQVLWTRLLASGSGNTTYIFTTILTIFLVGIAGGAALFTAGVGRGRHRLLALGVTQLTVAVLALIGTAVISGYIAQAPLTITILIAILPATLVMGLSLPIASGLAAQRDAKVASDTGLLLAVNTVGTVCGTFLVPFVLIPAIGSPRSVVALALVNALLGAWLLAAHRSAQAAEAAGAPSPEAPSTAAASPDRRPLLRLGQAISIVIVVVVAASLLLKPPFVADPSQVRLQANGQLLGSAEDEIASVQAGRVNNQMHLFVGGTSMTALTVDAKIMPLLPLMARPDAKSLLVIAFGMGSSYRESLIAGYTVQGVELVPSVPTMFHYYYPDSAAVLANPNGQVAITDGRNFVELTDHRYDVVVVDPPPPINSSGTAVLYSQEFYRADAARLNPGGIMMEWMPYYQNIDEFRAHVRTFESVFPNVQIMFGPAGYGVFMLGSDQPFTIDDAAARATLSRPGVVEDLTNTPDFQATTLDGWVKVIHNMAWISGDRVEAFGGTGPLITDDDPLTEYFLLRSLYGAKYPYMTGQNLLNDTPR